MGFESGLSAGGGSDEAHAVWEKKYVFVKKMVPGFVSEEFGKKVGRISLLIRGLSDTDSADLLDWTKSELHSIQLPRQ